MRPLYVSLALSVCLSACGSTTVVDGGPNDGIVADVTSDVTSGVTVDTTDTAAADTTTLDQGQTPETSTLESGGPAPCDTAGCACTGADGCGEALVCAQGLCCAPTCGEKVCGDDGCGGSCGQCDDPWGCNQYGACMICEPGSSVCVGNSTMTCNGGGDGYSGVPVDCGSMAETPICQDGACVCAPDCADKVCGDDGCGGSCGACDVAGTTCSESGDACVCAPQCDGVECGDDQCGGSCGECAVGVCNGGLCESSVFPYGEACENPYTIDKLPYNLMQGSTVLATDDEEVECLVPDLETGFGQGKDVVYSVNIPQDGDLSVGYSTWSDLGEPHWPLLVYVQTSCQKECTEYVQAAMENVSTVLSVPVQQGQTLFIVVDGLSVGDEGTYNLNVQLNP